MAKKTTKKKTKAATSKAPSKKVVKKTTAKTTKKPSAKRTSKKTSKAAPAASKKTVTKKTAKKTAAAKVPKKKTTSKKTTTKKTTTGKTSKVTKASATTSKKTTKKTAAKAGNTSAADKAKAGTADAKTDPKTGRKGITVVDKKPMRRPRTQPKLKLPDNIGGSLLSTMKKGPLISSGPDAPKSKYSALPGDENAANQKISNRKSPLKAADQKAFKQILVEKRDALIGDVSELERGALQVVDSDRGAFDVAEQGSDAYDQSLSLGLAAVDRKLIKEIDDALLRIENGSYGVCEMTGDAIKITRLRELPWTRYSIEGARLAEGGGQR